jgi:predicted DNA-binding helix-hairpin-helix protein
MLEGKEVDKTFDEGAGHVSVDVTDKGAVTIELAYEKDLDGYAKVKSSNSIETDIFRIAEKITAKTETTWDDQAVQTLKNLLGIKD